MPNKNSPWNLVKIEIDDSLKKSYKIDLAAIIASTTAFTTLLLSFLCEALGVTFTHHLLLLVSTLGLTASLSALLLISLGKKTSLDTAAFTIASTITAVAGWLYVIWGSKSGIGAWLLMFVAMAFTGLLSGAVGSFVARLASSRPTKAEVNKNERENAADNQPQ